MKITVRHQQSKIIIDESDNTNSSDNDNKASMRYGDQNGYIQSTLKVMVEQILLMTKTK